MFILEEVYMHSEKDLSPSRALAVELIFTAFSILKENGNQMFMKDLFSEVEKRVVFSEWAKERYEKSGYIRWESILHFYSIDCVKAGYLVKKSGIWYLTPEGIEAMKLGPEKLLKTANEQYRKWNVSRAKNDDKNEAEEVYEEKQNTMIFSEIQAKAIEGLITYINKLNPYEFQDLAAALLRGMGYYTPFVAPKGKDGGIDIIAYKDPLGTISPRIQVQIKHREQAASVQEIRQLIGLLQKEGDIGIFISTGGFTSDAKNTARNSHIHVELIDQNRFLDLWQSFYSSITEQDKNLLPLVPIYFLAEDN
ncbi:MAG TPA: Mrr restriction system protein [Bacillota bacterium]|nr:Mrr restriction system protein [Bacillota bacterium]HPM63529.1 Mrr restriction system protein [Bacillota bacterium]